MGEMITSFDGMKLYLNKEVPKNRKAVAVIVHGLCEHQGRYDYLAGIFHDAGIGTYRFDHRGHGRSEGERTYYSDFNQLLDDTNVVVDMAIAENPDVPIFLLGHSMGGFTVSLYGVKYPDKKLKGIITSWAQAYAQSQKLWTGMEKIRIIPRRLLLDCAMQSVMDWSGSKKKKPDLLIRY